MSQWKQEEKKKVQQTYTFQQHNKSYLDQLGSLWKINVSFGIIIALWA